MKTPGVDHPVNGTKVGYSNLTFCAVLVRYGVFYCSQQKGRILIFNPFCPKLISTRMAWQAYSVRVNPVWFNLTGGKFLLKERKNEKKERKPGISRSGRKCKAGPLTHLKLLRRVSGGKVSGTLAKALHFQMEQDGGKNG